jgi:hypothetical protein
MRKAGRGENDDSLEGRNYRAVEAFPDNDRGPADRATSISGRNPNSRSHTMEAAEKMAVNSRLD